MQDDENPEWTKADFARAKPAREILPKGFLAKIRNGDDQRAEPVKSPYLPPANRPAKVG